MRTTCILTTCFLAAGLTDVVRADPPPDGIYAFHEKGDGVKVKRNDTGTELILGPRLTPKVGAATIRSSDNSNTRLWMDLRRAGPFPKDEDSGRFVSMLAGHCFIIYSHSDREADGTRNLGTVIHGEEALRAVAQALKVEPVLRRHPGHKLLVTWRPEKPSYRPGEPIVLTMHIKNVGERAFSFMDGGRQRGPRDNQFGFTAFRGSGHGRAVPDTGDPTNFGGLGGMPTVKPGEVFTKSVAPDKWFKLTEPDTYLVTGMFRMEMRDPDGSHWTVWDDYAVGTCTVSIEEPKTKE